MIVSLHRLALTHHENHPRIKSILLSSSRRLSEQPNKEDGVSTTRIESEVNARVLRVEVTVGDNVTVDDVLMVLESMKMEIPVQSSVAGRVSAVHAAAGDTVEEGQLLIELSQS